MYMCKNIYVYISSSICILSSSAPNARNMITPATQMVFPVRRSAYICSLYISIYLSIYLSINQSICIFIYLSIYL